MDEISAAKTREERRLEIEKEHALEVARMVEEAKDPALYECSRREDFPAFALNAFLARRRGRSHVAKDMPCQDYCLAEGTDRFVILTAADGVGSCARSDEGARLACETAIATVRAAAQYCGSEQEFADILCGVRFREKLVMRWLSAVAGLPDTAGDADTPQVERLRQYASTLMWVVVTEHWYVAGCLGDGQILFFNEADAVKVRVHGRKESSRVRALVHERCWLEDFQVARFSRAEYSAVLMSTDGMYDVLSPGLHFQRYACQLKDRFLENGTPLQPFCYEEPGEKLKDLSMTRTMDDCTVVLAVCARPLAADVYADRRMADALADEAMLLRKSSDISLYLLRKGLETLQMAASPATGAGRGFPCLENASVIKALKQVEREGRRYVLYEAPDLPTLEDLFCSGGLRAKKEGNDLVLPLYRRLAALQSDLEKKGLTLTDAAAFLVYVGRTAGKDGRTEVSLYLMKEAVAELRGENRRPLFWQYFAALTGVLSCRNVNMQDGQPSRKTVSGQGEVPSWRAELEHRETASSQTGTEQGEVSTWQAGKEQGEASTWQAGTEQGEASSSQAGTEQGEASTCEAGAEQGRECPVFSCGYLLYGQTIPAMHPGGEGEPLLRVKQDGKGGILAVNVGKLTWLLPGGAALLPGEETPLADGLRFSVCAGEPEEQGTDGPPAGSETFEYCYRSRQHMEKL